MRFTMQHALLISLLACGLAGNSARACNLAASIGHPAANRAPSASAALAQPDNLPAHEATVVGLWQSTFQGADGSADQGFESFYADGNELLIDNSAPATDNVCSGVWEKTGLRTYTINHSSWDFDLSGNLIGIVVLTETVTVDPNGNKFKGTGSVTVYDPTLSTVVYQTTGTLTGVRITTKSTPL